MESTSIVSDEVLKRASGEFCVESIYILNYSCKGIFSLGSITKCLNLRVLDLSSNHLSLVNELAVLTVLEHLDLSNNNISQLDGFDKLEALARLELAGNKLSSFDVFLPLGSLFKLKHLTLQEPLPSSSTPHPLNSDPGARLSNPVCGEPAYRSTMTEMLPAVVWLDGETVGGRTTGSRFYEECRAIQEESGKFTMEHKKEGLPPLLDPLQDVALYEDDKIESLLAECSDTSERVQRLISNVKSELLSSKT